ncbi:MAG: hypothetical protein IE927_03980 [Rhodobacterales bacterium]|nr:hypothetical protein [Rhodobacterales bacterium]
MLRTDLRLPLVRQVPMKDIDFRVTGELRDAQSDRLVPGRVIAAPVLTVAADPAQLRLSGAGTLGILPFDAAWTQPLGLAAEAGSRIEGRATLDAAGLADLGVALPAGLVAGAGPATVTIDLPRGAPPRLQLSSDLTGLRLAIRELGWSKPAATPGRLDLTADLGSPPRVDRLAIEAPGLSARGRLTLRPGGGLDRATFDQAVVGRWFQGGVVLTGQGAGRPPGIEITGGRLDLRAMPRTDGPRPRGPAGPPIPVRLDRLEVSDTIALTGLTGRFSRAGGLNGDFTARVNGAAAITGEVVPAPGGSAIRIRSQDAGGVMAAAGIFARARGGVLDLTLTPGDTPGETMGDARVTNLTVRDMPVLAALLNAISVVGLIEQLNAQGLVFAEAQARFRLIPEGVEIRRASAVGASLGVSMEGIYDQARRRIRLQGVISPVYLLNGIGAILTRRGEGLFGFNYRVRGPVDAPEVSVNPLSILTPGMFRELFRGPAPQLGN